PTGSNRVTNLELRDWPCAVRRKIKLARQGSSPASRFFLSALVGSGLTAVKTAIGVSPSRCRRTLGGRSVPCTFEVPGAATIPAGSPEPARTTRLGPRRGQEGDRRGEQARRRPIRGNGQRPAVVSPRGGMKELVVLYPDRDLEHRDSVATTI